MTGISIILYDRQLTGHDEFGKAIYEDVPVTVDNVIVAEPSSQDVIDSLNLYGKKIVYTLGIPKGDEHEWMDRKVEFFGMTFKTFGIPTKGMEHLIPLAWNTKVKVELYE